MRRLRPVALVMLAALLAGCGLLQRWHLTSPPGSPGPATASPGTSPAAGHIQWVIPAASLRNLAEAGMSGGELRSLFDNTSTYIVESGGGSHDLSGWVAHRVLKFDDETTMAQVLATGVPTGTDTVLLDLEKWSQTPVAQQQNPGHYAQLGAQVAHQHGLTYLVTPGTDLAGVAAPGTPGRAYQAMLRAGVDGSSARGADMIGIQAQSLENDPAAYAAYVRQAAQQAQAAQPGIRVFAELSASPDGSAPSLADFAACIQGTRHYVVGYLLWATSGNAGAMASELKSLSQRDRGGVSDTTP
jgi:hypothetical protein